MSTDRTAEFSPRPGAAQQPTTAALEPAKPAPEQAGFAPQFAPVFQEGTNFPTKTQPFESARDSAAKSHPRGGAPFGNRNGEKHRGKANVVLGQAPSGYMRIYTAVRKLLAQLKAEYESRYGKVTVSTQEALQNACHWLVRSRCWHKWARQAGRTEAEQNAALTAEAECHDRYINRLRSIGLARQETSKPTDVLEGLIEADANETVPPSLLDDETTATSRTPPNRNAQPPGACADDVGEYQGAIEAQNAAESEPGPAMANRGRMDSGGL
jgi:hypothetical protein